MSAHSSRSIGTVATLSQYLQEIDRVWMDWTKSLNHISDIWFRGHADSSWPLLPGTLRQRQFQVSEHRYRHDFYLRAQPFVKEATVPPVTDWDWYFLMQHYGVPTRLLDWTESALVALYFAVQPQPHDRAGCVWILSPRAINTQLAKLGNFIPIYNHECVRSYLPPIWDEDSESIPLAPVSIDPPLNSTRLAAQRGKFTVHGKLEKPLEGEKALKGHLLYLRIPAQHKGRILRQLLGAGMTESVLFPGLNGLGRELRDMYELGFTV